MGVPNGAFVGILRLDGLDPTMAYAMGSHTGHTAITMRFNGELHVCESTVDSGYWPTNGVQKTPWNQWLQQAMAAEYQVVLSPLAPEYQKIFDSNVDAVAAWFETVEGLPYGFHNLIFGWVDTAEDNYPPPLSSHLTMVMVPVINDLMNYLMNSTTYDIWNQPLNKRLGTTGLTVTDLYEYAQQKGISFTDLITIVEEDSWNYENEGGVSGPSMVCDVLVMRIWKAGGIFGNLTDLIQAGEFTNWDAYSMAIFDSNYVNTRPQQCKDADPNLPYCQIMGEFQLMLNNWNTFEPYAHMRERCPTLPPLYQKPIGC